MSAVIAHEVPLSRGIIAAMAQKFDMDPVAFERTMRATVFPADASKEQFAAFLMVAKEYSLNPLTKQIYAFPDKKGGVVPIVPIDGWMAIINGHPQFDGMDITDTRGAGGKIEAVTCRIYRRDRSHPMEVTEYLSECSKGTEPWKQWPARMLRHKAVMQCARYAFSLSGIYDDDEAKDIVERDVTPTPAAAPANDTQPKPTRTATVTAKVKAQRQPAPIDVQQELAKQQEVATETAEQAAEYAAAASTPGFTDEALALLELDGCESREEADERVIDLCRGQPFYDRLVAARDKRFPPQE